MSFWTIFGTHFATGVTTALATMCVKAVVGAVRESRKTEPFHAGLPVEFVLARQRAREKAEAEAKANGEGVSPEQPKAAEEQVSFTPPTEVDENLAICLADPVKREHVQTVVEIQLIVDQFTGRIYACKDQCSLWGEREALFSFAEQLEDLCYKIKNMERKQMIRSLLDKLAQILSGPKELSVAAAHRVQNDLLQGVITL